MDNNELSWESIILSALVLMIKRITTPIYWLLLIIYIPSRILVLPMFALLLAFSIPWLVCFIAITILAAIARNVSILRPFAFIIVLPFVIIGALVVTLAPVPNALGEVEKAEKYFLLMTYPLPMTRYT